VPAVFIIVAALVVPAATAPVLNPPLSCVAVCVMESALRQAIVWPTRMLTGLGAYELLALLP
jgi:hypothetical protein